MCSNPHSAANSRNTVLAYCGPLLLQSILGTPCSTKIFISLITAAAVAPLEGIFLMKHILEYLSATIMYCPPIKIKKVRCNGLPWAIWCGALLQRCVTLLCLKRLASGTAVNHFFYILGHPRPVDYILCPKISLGESLVSVMELHKDLFSLGIWDEECFPFKDKYLQLSELNHV